MTAASPHIARHLDLARESFTAGRFSHARELYRKALKLDPDSPEILSELGNAEAHCGNVTVARRLMRKAVDLSPRTAAFHFNLGELERQAERHREAVECFRAALALDPQDVDALFGLGSSQLQLGNAGEALESLSRARELSGRDPEILNELGNALSALEHYREAIGAYRQALALRPDYFECWLNLALCLFDFERFEESNHAFDRAGAFGTIPDRFLWKRSQVQCHCGLFEQASATAQASISSSPQIHQAYFVKGLIAQYLGRFDDAAADFRAALGVQPLYSDAYEKLALMKQLSTDDAPALESILADSDRFAPAARASAGFTLYRLYDAFGAPADAFRALAAANALKQQIDPFDAEAHEAGLRRIAAVFSSDFLPRRIGEGSTSDAPIFIVGMPRSGTTLVEQILASCPGVHAGGEQMIVERFVRSLAGYPESLLTVGPDWAANQAGHLLERLLSRAAGRRHVTDKTLTNYRNIGLLAWLFPQARIVYCRRDPVDVGFSCYEQNFYRGYGYCNDLHAFVRAWRAHEEIMAHWQAVLPGKVLRVDYEALIAEPAVEARRLVEHCRLRWSDDCLDTTAPDRPIQTASFWQARQPINAGSVGKWRRYERWLAPLTAAFATPRP